jgi:cytochrome b
VQRINSYMRFTLVILTAVIVSCSNGQNSSSPSLWGASLEQIRSVVATAGHYPLEAVEVTASPRLLRITVSDATLAQADQLSRENSANSIVSAAEGVVSKDEIFASVQVINVAIVHPEPVAGSAPQSHTEDVLEFRKGPNNRFAHHIT